MKIEGNCHCGKIAFEAEVDPDTVAICHCTDCQMLTGSVFRANVPAPAESFRILRGAPRIYIKTADSGNKRAHAFCSDCGTPIYAAAPSNTATYSLRVGTIKQRRSFVRAARLSRSDASPTLPYRAAHSKGR
jgi:hypothetical protein